MNNKVQELTPFKPPSSNVAYLIAIVTMAFLGVAGVVAVIILRPTQDNAALFVAIGGFVGPTTAGLLAFMKSQETHIIVNSRMDEFKSLLSRNAATEAADARQEGVAEGLNRRETE